MVRLWAAGAECVDAKTIPEAHSISTYIPVLESKWDWSCGRLTRLLPSSQLPAHEGFCRRSSGPSAGFFPLASFLMQGLSV